MDYVDEVHIERLWGQARRSWDSVCSVLGVILDPEQNCVVVKVSFWQDHSGRHTVHEPREEMCIRIGCPRFLEASRQEPGCR